jgi:hypothetical protein
MRKLTDAVSKGLSAMGHRVDSFDARTDDGVRIGAYEYVLVLTEPMSALSGKIPESVTRILAAPSSLIGRRSAAFMRASGLFANKAMTNLYKAMEKEGMHLNWSEMVRNPVEAEALARKIGS